MAIFDEILAYVQALIDFIKGIFALLGIELGSEA